MDVSGVAPRAHGNGQKNCSGRTRRCQYGEPTLTMPVLGRIRLAGLRGANCAKALDGTSLPVRFDIPFATAADRRGGVRWGGLRS